jgi:hypothetical protein
MKQSFVQCAEVQMEPGSDPAAPGGAVTIALCGTWDHPGPCRWPHHTSATWEEKRGRVRVVFVAEEEEEAQIRALIDEALAGGECVGPDGKTNRWAATDFGAGVLSQSESELGAHISVQSKDESHP